jgi:hypothetical protein
MSAAGHIAKAKRVSDILPTFDPANGDMIIVLQVEDESFGRSFRVSPELGAEFRDFIFQAIREKAN